MSDSLTANQAPTKVRWGVFALAFGASFMLYVHRYALGYIGPSVMEEYGWTKTQWGALGSVFSVFYSWSQFPMGIATDLIGGRIILTGLIVLWTLGLAMHAFLPSLGGMQVARATMGLGQSAVLANISRITKSWFPASVRSTVQGLVGVLASRFGGMFSAIIVLTVMMGYFKLGWRTVVYILAAAGAVHALLFWVFFRNRPGEHPAVNEAELRLIEGPKAGVSPSDAAQKKPDKMSKWQLVRSLKPRALVNLVCLNLQSILSTFADNIFSYWIPLFLFEVYALKFKEMGIYSALPLLGGGLGGFAGGAMNDWLIRKTGNKRWTRSGVACFGKGMAAIVLFIALAWYESPYVFCGFLFFVKFFGDMSLTTSWAVVTDIGGKATATVFAFNNSIAGIGSMTAPLVYGMIADRSDWKMVFITGGCAYILCALSWLLINCTIPMLDESEESNGD